MGEPLRIPGSIPAADRQSRSNARFRQSDIMRAVKAARNAGLTIAQTEIASDGSIRLHHAEQAPEAHDAYEKWKEKRDTRST